MGDDLRNASCFQMKSSLTSEKESLEAELRRELSDLVEKHTEVMNDMDLKHSKELEAAEVKIKDLKDELVSHLAKGRDTSSLLS